MINYAAVNVAPETVTVTPAAVTVTPAAVTVTVLFRQVIGSIHDAETDSLNRFIEQSVKMKGL